MAGESQKKKILLIEDDVFMGQLLGQALERAGFELLAAKTGTEGIAKFQDAKPDIILLDLLLPDQNGFEALRQIRRLPGGATAKVLVLSNLARESQFEEAKRLGVVDYLVKVNFSLDEVLAKINETLAK
ncbi:MAG: response regulator [Patescibacteria group bacterium]